jgi:hypothetical protein
VYALSTNIPRLKTNTYLKTKIEIKRGRCTKIIDMISELIIPSLDISVSEKEVRRMFHKHSLGVLTKFRDKCDDRTRMAWVKLEWKHPESSKYIHHLEQGGCLTLVSEFPKALYFYLKK